MLIGESVMRTSIGASAEVIISCEEEPMWRQMTVPSSSHALKNGYQYLAWKLAYPSLEGFSENVIAWQPFAATRLTSAAISSGSQRGGRQSGMKRPG